MADGEIKAHQSTYAGFLQLFFWGGIGVFIVAAIVVFLISR